MLRFLLKLTIFALILLVLGSIFFLIIFPKYPELKIYASQINDRKIAHDITLTTLTKLSPPDIASVENDLLAKTALEHISPEVLAQYKNEGKVLFNMEKQNTSLYIQSVNINGKVVDGEDARQLERGFWHFPLSAQPGQKGNTVIIAHRFLHLPPRTDTFFNIDKVRVGDKITVNQKGGVYKYTVVETKVVNANDRSILMPTYDYRITLVTCHPLWTSVKRFVVIGKLDKSYQSI